MPIACLASSDSVRFGTRKSGQAPAISASFYLVKRQNALVRRWSLGAPWGSFKSCQPDH